MWKDDTPNRVDESTMYTIDVRHTQIIEYPELQQYQHHKPKAKIQHILKRHKPQFMPSLTTLGSGANGSCYNTFEKAKLELDIIVSNWITNIERYK